jgi:TrmH family RNA methyltransferase
MERDARIHTRLGARENDYAIGIFKIPETSLDPEQNHVVLVNPSGRGNLGSIIRTMLGFDFQDLAIILPAVDIYHPEAIRASMGAMFQIRAGCFPTFNAYRNAHPRDVYALMKDGEVLLPYADFQEPYCLVFGNESAGLPHEFRYIGTSISIPQSQKIDSLNLASSVSIALYEAKMERKR